MAFWDLELREIKRAPMTKEFWTVTEVIEIFEMDEDFLTNLEEEEIVCPTVLEDSRKKMFPSRELEKLRIAKILFEDMGVNLPGIEIILRMRQDMFDMRRQFDAILEDVAQNLRKAFGRNS